MSITVRCLTKEEAISKKNEIAELRIKIFKEFPYIYEGSLDYEVKYLDRYFKAQNANFIAALDEKNQLVGVATCLPLIEEDEFVKSTFEQAKMDISKIYYFGESVLLPEYRGLGIGHKFFDQREQCAKQFGLIKYTAFCAVDRPENHPLRPKNYQPLNEFWKKRGYEKFENLKAYFGWKDLDQAVETEKPMTFWLKNWG